MLCHMQPAEYGSNWCCRWCSADLAAWKKAARSKCCLIVRAGVLRMTVGNTGLSSMVSPAHGSLFTAHPRVASGAALMYERTV